MPTYRSLSDGKSYELVKGKRLGSGAYGGVGEVQGREQFAYKEIDLDPKPGDWVALTRPMRIKSTYRELWALQKLGYLEGVIREKNRMTIIMRKFAGTPEKTLIPNPNYHPMNVDQPPRGIDNQTGVVNEERPVATFKALLEINRKGVYHVDINPENSLIERLPTGELKANIIDFGHATTFSYWNEFVEYMVFDSTRPFTTDSYKQAIQAAKAAFEKEHQLEDLLYQGMYIGAGIGVVALFGFNSIIVWQLVRSSIAEAIIRELRAGLDTMDLMIVKNLESGKYTQNELMLYNALIKLGYVLINVYTLTNLFRAIPNLKLLTNLQELAGVLRSLDNSSIGQVSSNLIHHALLPLIYGTLEVMKHPLNYAHVIDSKVLEQVLSEIVYLKKHLKTTVDSLSTALEKVMPVDGLLATMDLKYQYHPGLLFKYGVTKAKEMVFGAKEDAPTPEGTRSRRGSLASMV